MSFHTQRAYRVPRKNNGKIHTYTSWWNIWTPRLKTFLNSKNKETFLCQLTERGQDSHKKKWPETGFLINSPASLYMCPFRRNCLQKFCNQRKLERAYQGRNQRTEATVRSRSSEAQKTRCTVPTTHTSWWNRRGSTKSNGGA